jgi:[acyl-carrier-protein] S-malonyltransferase
MQEVALLFPGQGSQVVGMGKDFFDNFRESKLVFEEAADTIHVDLRKLCFEGPADELTATPNLQPALFTAEVAMLAALKAHAGVGVRVCAGHSLGEYSALHAIGSLSVADGVRLTRLRGSAMQDAVPAGKGTMAAVLGLEAAKVVALCAKARELLPQETVEPANFNAPGQVVIAGTVDGVAKAVALLREDTDFAGGKSIPLQVSAPFHCSLMKPAREKMAKPLAETRFARPQHPLIANVTAMAVDTEVMFAGLLTDQITQPVRWEESMRALGVLGVKSVFEIGPGRVLAGLMKRIDRAIPVINISSVETLKESVK